ncbi:MAG: TIGR04211 family SH3 domain-containing protein [Myxococcota bacterium]
MHSFRSPSFRFISDQSARSAVWIAASFILIVLAAGSAAAEPAWIKGSIRLNLRSGAGTQYKILQSVETGDAMTVLGRSESWTRVRTAEGKVGWIPAGYLETEPPPTLRLGMLETETATLRTELEDIRGEASRLREANATLAASDSGQREQIESLNIENYELRAGSRYQEWITGALILALGMIIGAFLHRNSTRRPSSRIRL